MLISDGPHYYRIQVKTIDAKSDGQYVENKWKECNVDCVIYKCSQSYISAVSSALRAHHAPASISSEARKNSCAAQMFFGIEINKSGGFAASL